MTSGESYYYYTRYRYNRIHVKKGLYCAALFIYLNKTCFRGLYRESSTGFNVPYGHYKTTFSIDLNHVLEISGLIKNVIFNRHDFLDIKNRLVKDDFAYLDPPYAPENDKSFTKYNVDDFTLKKHNQLFDMCGKFETNNIKFLMSNADVDLVKNYFIDDVYNVDIIECRRAINSKKPGAKTNELLINNY